METFDVTVDKTEEAAEIPDRATKIWVTSLVLVVTIVGAIVGLLAATADHRAGDEGRDQEIASLAGTAGENQAYELSTIAQERDFQSDVDYFRGAQSILYHYRPGAGWLAPLGRDWLVRSAAQTRIEQSLDAASEDAYRSGAREAEHSTVDGQAAAAWRSKEESYVETVGLLALALFLFGLILTVHQFVAKAVFSVMGCALAVLGTVSAVQNDRRPIPAVSPVDVSAWVTGMNAYRQDDDLTAVSDLSRFVRDVPGQQQGWVALGHALDGNAAVIPTTAGLQEAVSAYRRAIDAGATSGTISDSLAADEMCLGLLAQARSDSTVALDADIDIDYPYDSATAGEIRAAQGDLRGAIAVAGKGITEIRLRDRQFRWNYFESLRIDHLYLSAHNPALAARMAPFYLWLQQREAALDLVDGGSDLRGGAAVSGVRVSYRTMDGNYAGGLVTVAARYRDFRHGIFSLRVYEDGFQLIPMSSVVSANEFRWDARPGTHTMTAFRVPLFPRADHTYDVELYWNGNLLATRTLVPVRGRLLPAPL